MDRTHLSRMFALELVLRRQLSASNQKSNSCSYSFANRSSDVDELREVVGKDSFVISKIESRGGRVVFVHLPSSLHILEYERRWFQRDRFWNVFAEQTSAICGARFGLKSDK